MILPVDPNRFRSHCFSHRVCHLIVHYTALNFQDSVAALTRNHVSSHYLIPSDQDPSYAQALQEAAPALKVYQLVDDHHRAWHAGVSAWANRMNLNDSSIGIELVYQPKLPVYPPFSEQQIQLLITLCQQVISRYQIAPYNVLGHSDIAYDRKQDPGPAFPWYSLYQAGVGAWYEEARKQHYLEQPMPSLEIILGALMRYGYADPGVDSDCQYHLIKAFQSHFRPVCADGRLDAETAAIALALRDRYCA